jgi:hypothetical protein
MAEKVMCFFIVRHIRWCIAVPDLPVKAGREA